VPAQQLHNEVPDVALCRDGPGLVELAGRARLYGGDRWEILRPVRVGRAPCCLLPRLASISRDSSGRSTAPPPAPGPRIRRSGLRDDDIHTSGTPPLTPNEHRVLGEAPVLGGDEVRLSGGGQRGRLQQAGRQRAHKQGGVRRMGRRIGLNAVFYDQV